MKTIKEEIKAKPTLSKPMSMQSKGFEKNFTKTMGRVAPDVKLNEVDGVLSEAEQSLKKKIFSLAKMEALVFSDPKLAAVYDEMSINGEEKYGYHYNETIMNMIFNDYVLNSPKYLQKYKMAIPKEKKRRDQSGINQLKKAGEEKMTQSGLPKQEKKPEVTENEEYVTKTMFLVNEKDPENIDVFAYFPDDTYDKAGRFRTGYSHIGQHSAVDPQYAKESRPATPEEYADLKAELESIGYNLEVLNQGVTESTSAGSAGGAAGYVGYAGPAAWGSGDLMKTNGKSKAQKKPIWKGGTIIGESNYLTDPSGFEEFINMLNEVETPMDAPIIDKTSAFNSDTIKGWNVPDTELEYDTLKTGKPDKPNLTTMEESKKIQEKSKSAAQQRLFGMAHAVQKGDLKPSEVGGAVKKIAKDVSPEDVEDFASTKHKNLPEKVDEDAQTMIGDSPDSMKMQPPVTSQQGGNVPTGTQQQGSAMNEDFKLLEELNNELNAYSIHQEKLKKMTEDRKPSSLVLKDRLGNDNEANFKKDLQHSGTKEIIDVEKELQWKDQQTDVPEDPQKLGQDIEKAEIKATDAKSEEHLKNVGDSDNDKGDEIPKRNLTSDEQHEVDMYRLGQHSLVYDNEPSERFEERMKSDMGDKIYKMRQEQMKFRGKAPMYNKDPQPVEDTTSDKVQFNKEQTGWNEREGLKESMITGRYSDALNKRRLIDFTLNEVQIIATDKLNESLFELDFTGLGNSYNSKTVNKKVSVNETVVSALSSHKFYTDGKKLFAVKNPVQNLNEVEQKTDKPVMNEQMSKMKHLLGYKPESFTNTTNVKKNRGF